MLRMYVEDKELKPARAHPKDAGLDLRAKEGYTVEAGEVMPVHTGVYLNMGADGWGKVGLVLPRSSLGKRGFYLANTVGVIDSDYRGEIILLFRYNPPNDKAEDSADINKYERVAQLIIMDCEIENPVFVMDKESLGETERGEGGFGSSGKY